MLRKANNDYKKIAEEAAANTSNATNQQQQIDNSAALVQEIDQLKNEIEQLKQQVSPEVHVLHVARSNLVPIERRSYSTSP